MQQLFIFMNNLSNHVHSTSDRKTRSPRCAYVPMIRIINSKQLVYYTIPYSETWINYSPMRCKSYLIPWCARGAKSAMHQLHRCKITVVYLNKIVCFFFFFSKYSFPTATRSTWCKKFPKELPSLPVAIIKHLPILCPSEGNVESQALKKQHLAILINSKGNETRKPCDESVIAIHCKKINIDSQNIELSLSVSSIPLKQPHSPLLCVN